MVQLGQPGSRVDVAQIRSLFKQFNSPEHLSLHMRRGKRPVATCEQLLLITRVKYLIR
jgi:hypothetical protein